jgi:SAM-dependent methyltransferase
LFVVETRRVRAVQARFSLAGTAMPSSSPPGTVDAAYLETAATQTLDANAAAVSVLRLKPGERVLDVGCGAGDGFAALATAVLPAGVVVGVDHDATLVRRAAERVLTCQQQCVVGDARALPFASASFDAVTCRYVLQHVEHPEQVLAEMRRVVKPGGRVSLLDADWASVSIAGGDVDLERRLMQLNSTTLLRNGTAGRQLLGLLRAAGFVDVGRQSFAELDEDLALVRELVVLDEIETAAVARGIATVGEIERWQRDLEVAAASGRFLALSTAVLSWGTR